MALHRESITSYIIEGFYFFCLLQRGHFPFGLDTFDNLYLDLPFWALKYT